jgi:hypothetical protein
MPKLFAIVLLCLLAGAWPVRAQERPVTEQPPGPSSEDLKVVAVMETLELMDLAEDLDMVDDMDFLIEEDPNESQDD